MPFKFRSIPQAIANYSHEKVNETSLTFLPQGEEYEVSITYWQLNDKAMQLADYLRKKELVGESVLLLYPSCIDYIIAFFGCLYAGVIAVPAYPPKNNHHATRLTNIVDDANVKAVMSLPELLPKIREQVHVDDYFSNSDADEWEGRWFCEEISPDNTAYLQYTSGSTGTPKGVMVTHRNIAHNCEVYAKGVGVNEGGTHVSWLPIFHDMGLVQGILLPLSLGAQAVFMPPEKFIQKPIRWVKAMSRYRAVMTGGPNFAYEFSTIRTTEEDRKSLDLSAWKVAVNGAEPVMKSTLDKFIETYSPYGFSPATFFPGYGMAETTLYVTAGNQNSSAPETLFVADDTLKLGKIRKLESSTAGGKHIVACGEIFPDTQIKIVNPRTLTECKSNEIGEIWVANASVCAGYWGKEEQTRETFQARLSDVPNVNFLRTGDLGFIEENQLYITGRLKDVIIIRGENHYPQDIEQTVENLHPAFRRSGFGAAFTIEAEDGAQLVVVQEVERTQRNKIDVKQICTQIRRAVFEVHGLSLKDVLLVKPGEVLKTSSGKVQRSACREKYLAGGYQCLSEANNKNDRANNVSNNSQPLLTEA